MPCLARQFLDNTFLNDLGSKSLLRSYTNMDICIVYISSNFNIWLDLNNGSVWLRYRTLLIVRMALFCRVIIFLIVIEFPHTCIPYVRWLCTSAKYRHLSACFERKSLALFIAKHPQIVQHSDRTRNRVGLQTQSAELL